MSRVTRNARALGLVLASLGALVLLDRGVGLCLEQVLARVRGGQSGGQIVAALEHRDVDVLVFGSSRARRHVDPAVLERERGLRAFNAGAPGQTLAYARMLEALWLARGGHARAFALQVDVGHLFVDTSARASVFAPFYGESPVVDGILAGTSRLARWKLRSRAYRYNSVALPLVARWLTGRAEQTADGFAPLRAHMSPERAGAVGPPWAPPPRAGGGFAPLPQAETWLRGFVRDARAAGVRCLIFLGPRFRGAYAPHPSEEIGRAALARWVEEEGGTFLPLDERQHPEFLDASLFADPGHLNARGAERLSVVLADALASLLTPAD